MNRAQWSEPTTAAEVARRAGGRAHYNSVRRLRAEERRLAILARTPSLLALVRRTGTQARLAQELGVSPATISRDVARLLQRWEPCPLCGQPVPRCRC